ncbi:MAG: hypothetical protein ACM37W_23005 [Actinomycetota bacterium]
MKAMHLLNLFVAGCIASSFLGWIAMLHPIALKIVSAILCSGLVIWGLAWILDDTLVTRLGVNHLQLQAFLIGSLAMLLIGMGVILCA